jgi:hypothetical protein
MRKMGSEILDKIDLNNLNLNRVRKRRSFDFWKNLLEFLKSEPDKREVLFKIWEILDTYQAFGSETNSNYSLESLALVLKENGFS